MRLGAAIFTFAALASPAFGEVPQQAELLSMFKGCVSLNAGDEFALVQRLSTEDCSKRSIVTNTRNSAADIVIDGYFLAVREKPSDPWPIALTLVGNFSRYRTLTMNDTRSASSIRTIRIKAGSNMINVDAARAESRFLGCDAGRAADGRSVSACKYRTAAMFKMEGPTRDALLTAWNGGSTDPLIFRAFMDNGEEFDGVLSLAEFIAIEQRALR